MMGEHAQPQLVPWSVPVKDYAPVLISSPDNDGADHDASNVPLSELRQRVSYCGGLMLDRDGLPRNPRGRTGRQGRGQLARWGPNHMAVVAAIHTPPHTTTPFVLVVRGEPSEGSDVLPGTQLPPNLSNLSNLSPHQQHALATDLASTIARTAHSNSKPPPFYPHPGGAGPSGGERGGEGGDKDDGAVARLVERCAFAHGSECWRGYIDHPSNTDNAWLEAIALVVQVPFPLPSAFPPLPSSSPPSSPSPSLLSPPLAWVPVPAALSMLHPTFATIVTQATTPPTPHAHAVHAKGRAGKRKENAAGGKPWAEDPDAWVSTTRKELMGLSKRGTGVQTDVEGIEQACAALESNANPPLLGEMVQELTQVVRQQVQDVQRAVTLGLQLAQFAQQLKRGLSPHGSAHHHHHPSRNHHHQYPADHRPGEQEPDGKTSPAGDGPLVGEPGSNSLPSQHHHHHQQQQQQQHAIQQLQDRLREHESTVEQALKAKEEAVLEAQGARKIAAQQEAALQEARQRAVQQEATNKEARDEVARLTARVAGARGDAKRAEEAAARAKGLEERIAQSATAITRLQGELKEKQDEVERSQHTLAKCSAQLERHTELIEAKTSTIARLEQEQSVNARRIQELNAQLLAAQEAARTKQGLCDELVKEHACVEKQEEQRRKIMRTKAAKLAVNCVQRADLALMKEVLCAWRRWNAHQSASDVEVTGWEQRDGVVYYEVLVTSVGNERWTVERRFKAFVGLRSDLDWKDLASFPSRVVVGTMTRHELSARAAALNTWLASVLVHPNNHGTHPRVAEFIGCRSAGILGPGSDKWVILNEQGSAMRLTGPLTPRMPTPRFASLPPLDAGVW